MARLETPTGSERRKTRIVELAGDPIRLARFLGRLMRDERVPKAAKVKLVGSGLYAWVDGDIVPDPIRLVPGLGYVEDVILLVHGIKCLVAETEAHVAAELWPGDEASFRRVLTALKWLDNQLFERLRGFVTRAVDRIVGPTPQPTGKTQQ